MKSFLGAMSKPMPPAAAMLPPQLCKAAAQEHLRHLPEKSAVSTPNSPHTLRHTSFKQQVKHPHINLVCSMCGNTHCSMQARYLYMPMLAKPWIPVCAACSQDHVAQT